MSLFYCFVGYVSWLLPNLLLINVKKILFCINGLLICSLSK